MSCEEIFALSIAIFIALNAPFPSDAGAVGCDASPDKPYSPADDEWHFLPRSPVTQAQIDEVLSKVNEPQSWYAGMFDEIANKLDGSTSDEVTLSDARKSLEFVTAVYDSARKNKNIKLPIEKNNPLYNSWLPK